MLRFDGRPGKRETNDYTAQLDGKVMGRFRTTHTVIAMRIDEGFIVDTVGGPRTGAPGDYLLIGEPGAMMWPCAAATFATSYEKIEDIA